MKMKRILVVLFGSLIFCSAFAQNATTDSCGIAPGLKASDAYTLISEKNLLSEIEPMNADGTINMVVEIPAGRTDKWEVKKDGQLHWDFKDGKPRIVQYLGYPCNYGMVPKTVLAKEAGGDGDPLDCLVLGASAPRGSVLKVKVIGVIKLLEKGEQDDKLLAVKSDDPLFAANSLAELNEKFPGVTAILETWFTNYKSPGALVCKGFGDVDEARQILEEARLSFQRLSGKEQ
jgi:inorganic pyrophosphatase